MGNRGNRVLFIALDALDGRRLRQWIDAGRLPNIARFAGQSHALAVRSDGATLHGSIWPTFAMGAGPGQHGIYWWTQWLSEEARYVRNSDGVFHYDPFWRAAVRQARRVVVVDVPYTPAVREPGVWTANGWGLHDEMAPVSQPAPLLRAIRRRYGRHPLQADTVQPMTAAAKSAMSAALRRGTAMRAQLVADFAARRDWDLFITTFSETHKAGHYLAEPEELGRGLTNDDALRAVVGPLDAALPQILENAGPGCDVILCSLHGIEAQVDYSAGAVGQLMALLAGRPPAAGVATPDVIRRLRDVLPVRLQDALWLALPPALRNRRFGRTAARPSNAADPLFAVAHDGSMAVRASLAGRERDGVLGEPEAKAVLARFEALASTAVTAGGQPAFGELLRLAERFPGPRAHRLPDALLLLNPEVRRSAQLHLPGGVTLPNRVPEARNGVHTGDGFCFFRPGTAARPVRTCIDSRDFAPTILRRLGVAPPPDLEGEAFLA